MSDAKIQRLVREQELVPALRLILATRDCACSSCAGQHHRRATQAEIRAAAEERARSDTIPLVTSPTLQAKIWRQQVEMRESEIVSRGLHVDCQACAQTGLTLLPLVNLAAYCGAAWAEEALGPVGLMQAWGRVAQIDPNGINVVPPPSSGTSGDARWVAGLALWGPRIAAQVDEAVVLETVAAHRAFRLARAWCDCWRSRREAHFPREGPLCSLERELDAFEVETREAPRRYGFVTPAVRTAIQTHLIQYCKQELGLVGPGGS